MIDLDPAREWLRDNLPDGESVEITNPSVLDRAAVAITNGVAETASRRAS